MEKESLVDKAKRILANIKDGNAFNMNLKAIRLIEELIKELEKRKAKNSKK